MREQLEHPDITAIERTGYPLKISSGRNVDCRDIIGKMEIDLAGEAEERTDEDE